MSELAENRKDKKKRKLKRELLDMEQLEEQMMLRYGFLAIKEMEHDRKMREKAIRLSRKRKNKFHG